MASAKQLAQLVFCLMVDMVGCCEFPKSLQSRAWTSDLKPRYSTKKVTYFWSDIMETQLESTNNSDILGVSQKYCVGVSKHGRYIISSERDLQSMTVMFSCVAFTFRSESVVQLMISATSKYWSKEICDDRRLRWHPWLLVAYKTLDTDYVSCPFSGGFDMKILEASGLEHICNSNDVPMRLESNCFLGEEIVFNLQDRNCIGDLPMTVLQKATCVTSWNQDGYTVVVVRKSESKDLWCLLFPLPNQKNRNMSVVLFTELACATLQFDRASARHYELQLSMRIQNSLCEDQHQRCNRLPCVGPFVNQCLKTCGKCDPNVLPTACDFPFYARGDWLINDKHARLSVNITDRKLQLGHYGKFDCVTWSGSPEQSSGMYTSVSLFSNGCKPRYTCIKIHKLGINALGFALSQSKVWPLLGDNIGRVVCNSDNFYGDPPPMFDRYRTYNDVYKPAVSVSRVIQHRPCMVDTIYKLVVTDQHSSSFTGAFYKDCSNTSNIRIELNNSTLRTFQDFSCIGQIRGKYWEKIILLQNHNDVFDTRCLIFSEINSSRVIMTVSAECDQLTWMYVDAGIRTPLYDMIVMPEFQTCKNIQRDREPQYREHGAFKGTAKDINLSGGIDISNSTQSTKRITKDVYNVVDYSSIISRSVLFSSDVILLSLVTCIIAVL